jgi:hypothetical protein
MGLAKVMALIRWPIVLKHCLQLLLAFPHRLHHQGQGWRFLTSGIGHHRGKEARP